MFYLPDTTNDLSYEMKKQLEQFSGSQEKSSFENKEIDSTFLQDIEKNL